METGVSLKSEVAELKAELLELESSLAQRLARVRERLTRCTAALARKDLPATAVSNRVKQLYYWLGWLDALSGEKP